MTVGLGIVSDIENAGTLLFAGLNVIVLATLLSKATSTYIKNLGNHHDANSVDAILRLQSFWLAVMVILTATVLKLVLDDRLADQIIAAWFVGQGFALQPYIQSYLSGIVVRSNKNINAKIGQPGTGQVYYKNKSYTVLETHILWITLTENTVNSAPPNKLIAVPWTEVKNMAFS